MTVSAGDELASIFPQPKPLMVAGRLVEIQPLGLARIHQFAAFLAPAFQDVRSFLASLDDASPDCLSIIAASCNVDGEWAQSLSGIDRLCLVVDILEVNKDAFPRVLAQLDRLYRALDVLTGPPQSSDSNPAASTQPGLRRKGQARSSLQSSGSKTNGAVLQ